MKKKLSVLVMFFMMITGVTNAQHVKVRLNFPVSVSIGPNGHRPYSDAIWIGPEWQWRGGRYEAVPGYWSRPRHHGAVWIPGNCFSSTEEAS